MIPITLLTNVAEIEPLEGNASLGPVYGAKARERVRFDGKRRRVASAGGQGSSGSEIISSGTIIARPDSVLNMGARVTVNGRAYVVVELLPVGDLNRVSHLEALVS